MTNMSCFVVGERVDVVIVARYLNSRVVLYGPNLYHLFLCSIFFTDFGTLFVFDF